MKRFHKYLIALSSAIFLFISQVAQAVSQDFKGLQVAYGPGPNYISSNAPFYDQILKNPKLIGLILVHAAVAIGAAVLAVRWYKNKKNRTKFDI